MFDSIYVKNFYLAGTEDVPVAYLSRLAQGPIEPNRLLLERLKLENVIDERHISSPSGSTKADFLSGISNQVFLSSRMNSRLNVPGVA